MDNLVAACMDCNQKRGAKDERENPGGLNARPEPFDWDNWAWNVD